MDPKVIHSIKARIKKLEAMTEARGCSPAEAANARGMIAELRKRLPPEEAKPDFSGTQAKGNPFNPFGFDQWDSEFSRMVNEKIRERNFHFQRNFFHFKPPPDQQDLLQRIEALQKEKQDLLQRIEALQKEKRAVEGDRKRLRVLLALLLDGNRREKLLMIARRGNMAVLEAYLDKQIADSEFFSQFSKAK